MSGLKFMVALVMVLGIGWSYWYSVSFTVLGGMLGVVVYLFLGELTRRAIGFFYPNYVPGTKLHRRMRIIVRIRQTSGLAGIALLTPIFLSVPVGTYAAIALGYSWHRILVYMFVAFSFWAFLLFGLYHLIEWDVRSLWGGA